MSDTSDASKIDLLVVDDDEELRSAMARHMSKHGYRVKEAGNGDEALKLAEQQSFHVALIDMMMPGMNGLELLQKLKEDGSDCEVVMLTGQGSIQTAVDSMKQGAHDFLTKPTKLAEIEAVLHKAYQSGQLRKENRQLKAVMERASQPSTMIGESAAMKEVFRLIERAGPTDKPILIQGESGTGKELVVRALHQASRLANKPLVVINCAALSEHLLESELFGHEKGAFTGAASAKQGLFELADGGSLFIDEIGEMPGALQAKLLRVLEDGSMRRVGSLKERRVNVRLVTATNRDMAEEVKEGRFREDLYYRIDVMTLRLPPLRDRGDDVQLLAKHFAGPDWSIEPDAMEAISNYHWPGNVRQLINAIDRAKILADEDSITRQNLPAAVAEYSLQPRKELDGEELSSIQKSHIEEILRRENGNKARAARALGVNRRSLYRLLEKHGIKIE